MGSRPRVDGVATTGELTWLLVDVDADAGGDIIADGVSKGSGERIASSTREAAYRSKQTTERL